MTSLSLSSISMNPLFVELTLKGRCDLVTGAATHDKLLTSDPRDFLSARRSEGLLTEGLLLRVS